MSTNTKPRRIEFADITLLVFFRLISHNVRVAERNVNFRMPTMHTNHEQTVDILTWVVHPKGYGYLSCFAPGTGIAF